MSKANLVLGGGKGPRGITQLLCTEATYAINKDCRCGVGMCLSGVNISSYHHR